MLPPIKFSHSAGKAQCHLGSLFGKLEDKWRCVGSVVLKRKQGLSDEQAAAAPGNVIDVAPKDMEGYACNLMLKRIRSATEKQTFFCADHDMQVNQNAHYMQHCHTI